MVRTFARNYRGADIDFDRSGVQWLAGFIEWLREKGADKTVDKRILALGAFFGECVIETFGGRWTFVVDSWKLERAPSRDIDPFLIIRLHLECGQRKSVLAAFDAIPVAEQRCDER